jgi:hypothetical protein
MSADNTTSIGDINLESQTREEHPDGGFTVTAVLALQA